MRMKAKSSKLRNSSETPVISSYIPQNNHVVFQVRKVAIRSPRVLEFALVKPKEVANERQVGFRALCHPVTESSRK